MLHKLWKYKFLKNYIIDLITIIKPIYNFISVIKSYVHIIILFPNSFNNLKQLGTQLVHSKLLNRIYIIFNFL